jgi:hypothetical protein
MPDGRAPPVAGDKSVPIPRSLPLAADEALKEAGR